MNYTSDKIERAIEASTEFINDLAPGVPRLTDVAEKVAENLGCSVDTARKHLRTAVAAGRLIELKPTRSWFVSWPSAEKAGFTLAHNLPRMTMTRQWGTGEDKDRYYGQRIEITVDRNVDPPGLYGPGNTTYLITTERADALTRTWTEERDAEEEAEEEARKARKKAERQEIDRRQPGLRTLARRLSYMLRSEDDFRSDGGTVDTDLIGSLRGDEPMEEQKLHLTVNSWGNQLDFMRTILEAGMSAYLADQPVISCQHCGQRIVAASQRGEQVWWHIETAVRNCKGTDIKAAPESLETTS